MSDPIVLLRTAYRDLSVVLGSLTAAEGWEPTGCAGWTPVDLGFHLLSDARRALVALNTPADGPADTTAVDYWQAWRPPAPDDEDELWSTRVAASVQGGFGAVQRRYAEAAPAVVVAAGRVAPSDLVRSQAAVHHLDLVLRLDRPGPSAAPLAEVRRILSGLYGGPLPDVWDDVTAARRGTGREPLTAGDRAALGAGAERFPLFG